MNRGIITFTVIMLTFSLVIYGIGWAFDNTLMKVGGIIIIIVPIITMIAMFFLKKKSGDYATYGGWGR